MTTPTKEVEIQQFMIRAQEMLAASEDTVRLGHYSTAVNRSYYAIFYAANALLRAIDEKRSKHHGVLSAFRQYFIKPGLWPNEFSRIYGRVLEERERAAITRCLHPFPVKMRSLIWKMPSVL